MSAAADLLREQVSNGKAEWLCSTHASVDAHGVVTVHLVFFAKKTNTEVETDSSIMIEDVEVHLSRSEEVLFGFCHQQSPEAFARIISQSVEESASSRESLSKLVWRIVKQLEQTTLPREIMSSNACLARRVSHELQDVNRRNGIDLKICLLKFASCARQRHMLCEPYPPFLPADSFEQLNHIFDDLLPPLPQLAENEGKALLETDQRVLHLLAWLLRISPHPTECEICDELKGTRVSCRLAESSHIAHPMASAKRLISAYHGTSPENAFAILHEGLVSGSGTKLMKNGQVFGSGIYLSLDRSVAEMFSSQAPRTQLWRNSQWNGGNPSLKCTVVFECRVVDDAPEQVSKHGGEKPYLVVKDPGLLAIDRLHLYITHKRSSSANRSIHASRHFTPALITFCLAVLGAAIVMKFLT